MADPKAQLEETPSDGAQTPSRSAGARADDRVVIEHLLGMRRGQRVEFPVGQRVRFGRHPASEVAFDARRDLDASSHHAELSWLDGQPRLCDVGSSNGTLVTGQRITELELIPGEPLVVEFGPGGPRIRLFIGQAEDLPPLPKVSGVYERVGVEFGLIFVLAAAVVLILAVVAWITLV